MAGGNSAYYSIVYSYNLPPAGLCAAEAEMASRGNTAALADGTEQPQNERRREQAFFIAYAP